VSEDNPLLSARGAGPEKEETLQIFIINPNSDDRITDAIHRTAAAFGRDDFDVVCKSTPGAPSFIETYADAADAAPGMIQLIKDNHETSDGFVIACHSDPNLDVMKEISRKPVAGIGETSMKLASMLGHRFSVLSDNAHSIPNKETLVRRYHLEGMLASIRAPEEKSRNLDELEKYYQTARKALDEDGAEVIVLGCAAMTGMDKALQKRLQAPVLDGVACALIIISGLIKCGLSTSKIRRYNPQA
jgi:allantoin racemase